MREYLGGSDQEGTNVVVVVLVVLGVGTVAKGELVFWEQGRTAVSERSYVTVDIKRRKCNE